MQALLRDIPLPTLQLLQKVTEKAISTEDEKFRTLKRSNETLQTKLFSVPKAMQVMELMGWTNTVEGLVLANNDSVRSLELGLSAIEKSVAEKVNADEKEYEERRVQAAARAVHIQQKQAVEQQRKDMELKKIKSIQSDVRDRVILDSKADPTMGRSSAAQGIFAGAGGKSSSARTFSDIGVNLNE